MKTIADHAIELMAENARKSDDKSSDYYWSIWVGDPDMCHEVAERAGIYDRVRGNSGSHPLNIIQKVIDGVQRDRRFKKGWIRGLRKSRYLTLIPEFRGDEFIQHRREHCDHCDLEVIICGKCGNNTCNAGYGILSDGSECDKCPEAYGIYLNK